MLIPSYHMIFNFKFKKNSISHLNQNLMSQKNSLSLRAGLSQRVDVLIKNFQIGTIIAIFTQPFEVLRTSSIQQAQRIKGAGSIRQLFKLSRQILKKQGSHGFFRGSILAIMKNGLSCCVFFTGLHNFNKLLNSYVPVNKKPENFYQFALFSTLRFLNACVSKAITTYSVSPLVILKTRVEAIGNQRTTGWKQASKMYSSEGIKGFYRGVIPTLMRDVPWSGLQYSLYSCFQLWKYLFTSTVAQKLFVLLTGSVSSVIAVLITYPFDNIRVRMQLTNQKVGIYETMKTTVNQEGISGLYKGYLPRIIKKGVSGGLLWLIYESIWKDEKKININ